MAIALTLVLSACVLTCLGHLEDEVQLYERECLREDMFPCMSGGCVSQEQYCDGQADCPDGSDEDFCPQHAPDPKICNLTHKFLCEDGKKCIPRTWLCNNDTDCDDNSDEASCFAMPESPANSTCKGFLCDDDKCISKLWVCDGSYDCEDRSDEFNPQACRRSLIPHKLHDSSFCQDLPSFEERNYRCIDSSYCLPINMMCDGLIDCRDGSDEGIFCENWRTMCLGDKNPCKGNETKCYPDRSGPSCACMKNPNMRRYNYSTGECDDIDECAQARPQCSHMCENKDGHFACKCDEGYNKDKYEYLCYAKGPEGMLFFSTSTDIRYVKLKSKQEVVLATGVKQAHGVAFDGKYLYWVETEHGHQAIMRAQLDNIDGTKEVLVSLGLEDPGDIALDWVGGHFYQSDVHRGTISACSADGSTCVTIHTNSKQPRFVTLAVRYGKMYWADWHHRPLIMEANMDGSQPQILVDNLRTFATGLAVDEPNHRLYFVDKTIRVIKLDDKQIYSLFEEPFHHPYSIAVFENTVYWSDWTSNSIQTTDKVHGSRQKRDVISVLNWPVYDMHVYHPVLVSPLHNPCENHTCSHLCLKSSNVSSVCACPDGMALNGTTCYHSDGYLPQYLILGGGSSFSLVEYDVLGNPESHSTHFDIGRVQAMAFDNTRNTLYVYDGQRKVINYINMTDFSSGVTHLFMLAGLDNVVDMDYDYITDSLYIVDAGRRFIEVVSLKTKKRALLYRFKDQEIPISFCVMPDYGRMLVAILETEQGNEVHIDSISLDGQDRKNLIMNDLKGPTLHLRYDRNTNVVYIGDDGNGVIDLVHAEGSGRENFRKVSTTLNSLSVTDSHLFWTDRRGILYWSNVHEALHYIRSIPLSIFPANTSLHIQATFPPPDPVTLDHPCRTTSSCSDVCVQTPHAPTQPNRTTPQSRNDSVKYKCLCTPGLLLVDGQCTPLKRCQAGELYCHNTNTCAKMGGFCNGVRDCPNGEDEEDCQVLVPSSNDEACSTGYKLCNGICVSQDQTCTGDDTITTTPTPAPKSSCSKTEYKCLNSSICIERAQVCDGDKDCPDGSDEAPSACNRLNCLPTEFRCTSGSCILASFRCDGDLDCTDGSDEEDCSELVCGLGSYQCRSKQCIEFHKRCDHRADCLDASDEEDCGEPPIYETKRTGPRCAPEEFGCELNMSICLPMTARCNMITDCPGGTDEAACDHRCKPHGLYECKQEYQCLAKDLLCDGHRDCMDGSDEIPDACILVNRTSALYPAMLYPADECHDGFLCGTGQCIEWRHVCDKIIHCYDGSDENGQCATACNNNTCDFSCIPTPPGPHCLCPTGLRTAPDHHTCVDVDECQQEVCSQVCVNVYKSFNCKCHTGYALRRDRRTCKAASGDMSIIYISDNVVWQISADGQGALRYSDSNLTSITDLATDIGRNKLYLSYNNIGKIVEVNSSSTDMVVTNVGKPTRMAVDWVTGNVYFADSTLLSECMRVCNFRDKRCAKLQKLPANSVVSALVVDPANARMFYCVSRGASGVVWSASLAGQRLTDLVQVRNCSGLAVDSFKKLLYVVEATPARMFRIDFNGGNQQSVIKYKSDLKTPRGLALFEDSVYFLTAHELKLSRCSLFGRESCRPYLYRDLRADSFVLRHQSVQRNDVVDVCRGAGCSGICVLEEGGHQCVCDDGTLAVDGGCHLMLKNELPLFNGWTYEEYERAHNATLTVVLSILGLAMVYFAVFVFYKYVYKPRRNRPAPYMEVRFQNTHEETNTASTSVLELPASTSAGHEFVNPLQYMRDFLVQMRGQKRPIGTAGLDINVPRMSQDLSDTESDLDEQDTKKIIHKQ